MTSYTDEGMSELTVCRCDCLQMDQLHATLASLLLANLSHQSTAKSMENRRTGSAGKKGDTEAGAGASMLRSLTIKEAVIKSAAAICVARCVSPHREQSLAQAVAVLSQFDSDVGSALAAEEGLEPERNSLAGTSRMGKAARGTMARAGKHGVKKGAGRGKEKEEKEKEKEKEKFLDCPVNCPKAKGDEALFLSPFWMVKLSAEKALFLSIQTGGETNGASTAALSGKLV